MQVVDASVLIEALTGKDRSSDAARAVVVTADKRLAGASGARCEIVVLSF